MKTFFNTNNLLAMALMSVAAATGCDTGEEDFGAGDVNERCLGFGCGTIKLNTFQFGKLSASELSRDNTEIYNGTRLVEVRLLCPAKDTKTSKYLPKDCYEGAPTFKLDDVWSSQGELRGRVEGQEFKGGAFFKSQWFVEFSEEGVVTDNIVLTVNKYDALGPDHFYTFDYPNPINPKETLPACKETLDPVTGQVVGTKAVAIEDIIVDTDTGIIDNRKNMIYIACVSGAIGKATTWGYKPYDPAFGVKYFTGAVRVVRADYCGDGDSWTTVGNALQLADKWGYSSFNANPGPTEALWTVEGAACLGEPRWVGEVKYENVICNGDKLMPCKAEYDLGSLENTLFWSKLP